MTHEYDDPVASAKLERAKALLLRRWPEGGNEAVIECLAWTAVEEVFCTCVTGAEDAAEGQRSSIHSALVFEVLARARAARPAPAVDRVEIASEQSFPASDPPGWIWQKPPAPRVG